MAGPPSGDDGDATATADDLLAADVLGAFGVRPADVERRAGNGTGEPGTADSLEAALVDVLSDGRDRTAVLREVMARSARGINCSARYPRETLAAELTRVFESIGWSFDLERAITAGPRDRLELRAADLDGRRREASFEYPETPLGTDNLPAVLWAIEESLLAGTDARFVLLSAGVDRWRAALVDGRELESLRERYGPRIEPFDRPLLPEDGLRLEAYVPDAGDESAEGPDGDGPWPDWATDRERNASTPPTEDATSLIEEAEAGSNRTRNRSTEDSGATSRGTDGFELRGSPSVSRVSEDEGCDDEARGGSGIEGTDRESLATGDGKLDSIEGDPEFGSLSGTVDTARVSNDSFGSGVEWETENDRYRALGAALGAGGDVSVRGLLEDDDFLPELPAAEPDETRIEFAEEFDPGAVRRAEAAAEQSGFVWVDSGSLETTRLSNG
ncbi:hypothetical protein CHINAEXTREME_05755 [Halobiforma lacisalsi AJ5]|uniref:Uncharacterized protein n=1 Tax=Natronobacterium lacisalsi AJ5 TaxID=358396 RepID=M0LP55_NATLA|nr:hypothetical protein [Halobiforma lacisalsi]APW97307.1 hypothetical protein CHINAEXTREME_05755 [Halobiforma lacisalsi AJ5]EMA33820.1 hypothetical protein C445_09029 [Halobiforma lacisalsi AJ5]